MRLVRPLLFLGIALAPAIATAGPGPRRPLASRDGRPAVGNIGQRGRLERDGRPEHAARARTVPLAQRALRAAQEAAAVEVRTRPLVTEDNRPAVGNVGKGRPKRLPRQPAVEPPAIRRFDPQ
jgi:hypothetical protein